MSYAPSALTTIEAAKGSEFAYQPVLLVTITLRPDLPVGSQTTLKLSTHPIDNTYLPRLVSGNIDAIKSLLDTGADVVPAVSFKIDDSDGTIFNTYEKTIGFKGASMICKVAFFDVTTATLSTNQWVVFNGRCNPLTSVDQSGLATLSAISKLNMQRAFVPPTPCSTRCTHAFPGTADQQKTTKDPSSPFYKCGYDPLGLGGTAEGSLNGGVPFTTCNRDPTDCTARGMKTLGRPNWVLWEPPDHWRGKAYESGNVEQGINSDNKVKWSKYFPLVYYVGWVQGLVLDVTLDPNSTRSQVVIGSGDIGPHGVLRVIVDDAEVPHAPGDTVFTDNTGSGGPGFNYSVYHWGGIDTGGRNGRPCTEVPYNGQSDPVGSQPKILIVVPRKLHSDSSAPNVQVLVGGPQVRVYSDATTFALANVENPLWILLDLLVKGPWTYAELDIQRFVNASSKAGVPVTYTSLTGATSTHALYSGALVLQERTALSEVVYGFRNANNIILTVDPTSGLLGPFLKETLYQQQPSAITGSNDNTAYPSYGLDGSAQTGRVAYWISENDILTIGDKGNERLRISFFQEVTQNQPNIVTTAIQNEDNLFVTDTFYDVDTDDLQRNGNWEIPYSQPLLGVKNIDQLRRRANTIRAESMRGNPRSPATYGDPGGTMGYVIDTTFKLAHVQPGQIISLSYAKHGWVKQLFRVQSIQPTLNYDELTLTVTYHNDLWYISSYGQGPDPQYTQRQLNPLDRPPYGLVPVNGFFSLATDSLLPSQWFLACSLSYGVNKDGTANAILTINTGLPANDVSVAIGPPLLPKQGTTGTDGFIPAGRYYVAIAALDKPYNGSDFNISAIQQAGSTMIADIATPGPGSITVPSIFWQGVPANAAVFMGTNPNKLYFQGLILPAANNGTVPNSFQINAYTLGAAYTYLAGPGNRVTVGPLAVPDQQLNRVRIKTRNVNTLGVAQLTVTSVDATTIQVDGGIFTPNQFNGYDIGLIGHARSNKNQFMAVINYNISSHTADTFTVTAGNPLNDGIVAGDQIIIYSMPTVTIDSDGNHSLSDPNWINAAGPQGQQIDIIDASNTAPITITTLEDHPFTDGDNVHVRDVPGNTAANGDWAGIVVLDPRRFTLPDPSSGNGDYDSSTVPAGVCYYNTGLNPQTFVGSDLYIFAGPGSGQTLTIQKNGGINFVVNGQFFTPPTSASRYAIVEPNWSPAFESRGLSISNPRTIQSYDIDISNLKGIIEVGLFLVDSNGKESFDSDTPTRFLYLPGDSGRLGINAGTSTGAQDTSLIISYDGPPQSAATAVTTLTTLSTARSITLSGTVTDLQVQATDKHTNLPVPNVPVTFTAPASGASGLFTTPTTPTASIVVRTNAQGIATAPTFTANTTTGTYNIAVSAPSAQASSIAVTNSSISITAPTENSIIAGTLNFTVTTVAPSGGTITLVQYFSDGLEIGRTSTTPYTLSVNTTTLADGVHTITAKVTDSFGLITTSQPKHILISNSGVLATYNTQTGVLNITYNGTIVSSIVATLDGSPLTLTGTTPYTATITPVATPPVTLNVTLNSGLATDTINATLDGGTYAAKSGVPIVITEIS